MDERDIMGKRVYEWMKKRVRLKKEVVDKKVREWMRRPRQRKEIMDKKVRERMRRRLRPSTDIMDARHAQRGANGG